MLLSRVFLQVLVGLLLLVFLQESSNAQIAEDVVVQCLQNQLTAEELLGMSKSEGSDRFMTSGESSDENSFDLDDAKIMWAWATAYEWERLANQTHPTSDNVDYGWTGAGARQWSPKKVWNPFLFCSRKYNASGHERFSELKEMLLAVDPSVEGYLDDPKTTQIMMNREELSCAITRIPAYVAAQACFTDTATRRNEQDAAIVDVVIQPYISLMKMTSGSLARLENAFLYDGDNSTSDATNKTLWANKEANYDLLVPLIQVQFCAGAVNFTVDGNGNPIRDDQVAKVAGERLRQALLDKSAEGSSEAGKNVQKAFFNLLDGTTLVNAPNLPTVKQSYREKLAKKKEFWDDIYKSETDAIHRDLCERMIRAANFTADEVSSTVSIQFRRNYTLYNNETGEVEEEGWFRREDAEIQKLCAMAVVSTLTGSDLVCSLEVQQDAKVENTISAYLQQTGIRDSTPFYDVGLNGAGQVVSVSDTGLDLNNCYFKDGKQNLATTGDIDSSQRKVVQYVPFVNSRDYPSGHGTHVCGTLVGDRSLDGVTSQPGMATGVAHGAKLAFFDIGFQDGSLSIPIPVDRIFQTTSLSGAKFHSASWGSESNAYGFNARGFDRQIFDNPDYLIMVAAGNSGGGSTFRSVGDPATAKNIIAVGAGNSDQQDLIRGQLGPAYVADFSSRGPTFDGRTKPDIIAPGKFILSANAGGSCDPSSRPSAGSAADGVLSLSGTSMATPGVAGTAAIIRQYFVEGWYPDGTKNETNSLLPSAALIKAVILNGGQPMDGVDNGLRGIENSIMYDQIQNMGHVSYVDSIYLPNISNVKLRVWDGETVPQGSTLQYTVTIDKSGGCTAPNLSVTLVWTDTPAQAGCVNCLINDLDMVVENNATGAKFFPNGLNRPDRNNNVERVRIAVADQEVYKITVTGFNSVFRDQTYALVATGCFGNPASSLDFSLSTFNDNGLSFTMKIVIGVVCGVVGVTIIGVAVWLCQRRRVKTP